MSFSGSIFIYNLPETFQFLDDGFLPITNSEVTRKITGGNLRTYIDKTVTLPVTTSLAPDDFIKVDSVSSGTRKVTVKNSIFYSVSTGSFASNDELVKGDDFRLTNSRPPTPHGHDISEIGNFSPTDYILSGSIGVINGVAPIGPDGKVPDIYINPFVGIDHASDLNSDVVNLINQTNVQGAINQLSDAAFIRINSASANVVGTQTVQGALAQKLSLTGGTLTGPLFLPNNGFRVGSNTITVQSSNVGIGVSSATNRLDVSGGTRLRDFIYLSANSNPTLYISNSDLSTRRYAITRQVDTLKIGPVSTTDQLTSSLSIGRDSFVTVDSKLILPTNKVIQFGGLNESTDTLAMGRFQAGSNRSELRILLGDDPSGNPSTVDKFVIGTGTDLVTDFTPRFVVNSDGSIGNVGRKYSTKSVFDMRNGGDRLVAAGLTWPWSRIGVGDYYHYTTTWPNNSYYNQLCPLLTSNHWIFTHIPNFMSQGVFKIVSVNPNTREIVFRSKHTNLATGFSTPNLGLATSSGTGLRGFAIVSNFDRSILAISPGDNRYQTNAGGTLNLLNLSSPIPTLDKNRIFVSTNFSNYNGSSNFFTGGLLSAKRVNDFTDGRGARNDVDFFRGINGSWNDESIFLYTEYTIPVGMNSSTHIANLHIETF
jgi:hypothetical protein